MLQLTKNHQTFSYAIIAHDNALNMNQIYFIQVSSSKQSRQCLYAHSFVLFFFVDYKLQVGLEKATTTIISI